MSDEKLNFPEEVFLSLPSILQWLILISIAWDGVLGILKLAAEGMK